MKGRENKMFELRVCVTLKCNYKCTYCSKDGEGIYSDNSNLRDDEIISIVEQLSKKGVSSVRLTGGEPFCRKGLVNLAGRIRNIVGIENVSLVTNGALIDSEVIDLIAKRPVFSYISVSLDTLQREKYREITKSDTLGVVIDNIRLMAKQGIKTRINYVLTKENQNEFDDILEFCINGKIDLKVLDLYNNKSKYVCVDVVKEVLLKKGFVLSSIERIIGDLGTPMEVYEGYDIKIIVKDSRLGTTYSDLACSKCKRYPCQLGVIGPIMTHDGIIKICTLGREMGINCFTIDEIDNLYEALSSVSNVEKKWNAE